METVDHIDWPSRRVKTLLVLGETAIALSRRLGIEFTHEQDQLGRVWLARFRSTSGSPVELSWHPDGPAQGVAVSVDDCEEDLALVRQVVDGLELQRGDIAWLSPEVLWWLENSPR